MRVHGYVPQLRPLFSRMRLSVAPLRWGAGVKGKVNSAHQLGVPVVCTSIAVSGMHATDGKVRRLGLGLGLGRLTLTLTLTVTLTLTRTCCSPTHPPRWRRP